jgi:hypothetical protein
MSFAKTSAIRWLFQPGSFGALEKPKPGSDGATT